MQGAKQEKIAESPSSAVHRGFRREKSLTPTKGCHPTPASWRSRAASGGGSGRLHPEITDNIAPESWMQNVLNLPFWPFVVSGYRSRRKEGKKEG